MRSKKIFRQAMSVAMAVVMSASSVFPVYASDTAGDTDTTSETTVDLADLENDSTVSEAEESETPETEDYEPYVLYLPKKALNTAMMKAIWKLTFQRIPMISSSMKKMNRWI